MKVLMEEGQLTCMAAAMLKAYISRTQPKASLAAGEFSMCSVKRTQSKIICTHKLQRVMPCDNDHRNACEGPGMPAADEKTV